MPWEILTLILMIALIASNLWWRRQCRSHAEGAARRESEAEASVDKREQAAERERAQQGALFDSMVEGVLLLNRENRVALGNRALEELFGFTSDIRGRSVMEAFRLNDLQDIVNRTIIEGKVVGTELELPGLDNRVLEVNAAVSLNPAGEAQGSILVFHDLTRIKRLENMRKEFVANVSHELRTPLSMIKGYVETLIDGAVNEPEVAPKFLGTIQKHADRLTVLIEDLLTISQLESGQVSLNLQSLELAPVVGRVADDLSDRAGERKVRFVIAAPEGLRVRADSDRLQQALFNLLENAIKYGGEGAEVRVDARRVNGEKIEVSVVDQGPGIPRESIERIFERFYRVDRARSRDQGGTGLGLSIVKHIVQSHGGEVWARSELGKGTTFLFTLRSDGGACQKTSKLEWREESGASRT
jgi:two-component system phosphate regulon sensor histidine kinase PhoR